MPAHFGTIISPWTCLSPFLPQFASLFTALHLPFVASTSIAEVQLMFAVHFEMTPGFKIKKQTTSYTIPLYLWTSRRPLVGPGLLEEKAREACVVKATVKK